MAIKARTTIDQIELRSDGSVGVRLLKSIFNGKTLISTEYHRTVIAGKGKDDEETISVRGQMDAVNEHLAQMGFPNVEAGDFDKIEAAVKLHRGEK